MGRKDKPISNALSDGALLRQARQAQGITLTSMAESIFYSKSHLSDIENGKVRATLEIKMRYAEVLKIELSALNGDGALPAPSTTK